MEEEASRSGKIDTVEDDEGLAKKMRVKIGIGAYYHILEV